MKFSEEESSSCEEQKLKMSEKNATK